MEPLEAQLALFGVELDAWLYGMVTSFLALLFTNMPVFVALFAANSVIHERTCGTMPFLMLSPLTRWQLLAGKLSGAMALPLLLHLVFVGGATLVLGRLEVLADHSARMGGSLSWWIAFLVGGPAAAALLGTFGTVVSALARDMRTSLHYTNFFVFILGTGSGFVLVDGITKGLWLQLLFASGCLVVTLVGLTIGARLISRDVPPT